MQRTGLAGLGLLLSAFPLVAQYTPPVQLAGLEGDLTILLRSYFGDARSLASDSVMIEQDGPGVFVRRSARNGEVVRLPYGNYRLTLTGNLIDTVVRKVKIEQPTSLVVIPRIGQLIDSVVESVSVTTKVDPASPCNAGEQLWAKLVAVFALDVREQTVTKGGFVLFDNVYPGKYLLVIVEGMTIRATQEVDAARPITSIETALLPCK